MEYPKINTLFKRDLTHTIIHNDYSCPEFKMFNTWNVQEKIDGMNIRIFINGDNPIVIKGRTENADVPQKLIDHIKSLELNKKITTLKSIVLFGEGFGPGIQSGGIYRSDMSFILFDAYMSGRWSTREEVKDFATTFNLEEPPYLGTMETDEIIDFIKSKPHGYYNNKNYILEGIIARSNPLVRFNSMIAEPIMFKLKVRDFLKLR